MRCLVCLLGLEGVGSDGEEIVCLVRNGLGVLPECTVLLRMYPVRA